VLVGYDIVVTFRRPPQSFGVAIVIRLPGNCDPLPPRYALVYISVSQPLDTLLSKLNFRHPICKLQALMAITIIGCNQWWANQR